MKGQYSKKYTKSIVTILTTMLLTLLVGFGSVAYALGSVTDTSIVEYTQNQAEPAAVAEESTAGADVTLFGADGSDQYDDTAAIQAVLDAYDSVYIPDGTYYINVEQMLHLNSGQTLTLSDGATLQALPTSSGYYRVITINNVSDVTVTGGQIIGERAAHTGWDGEWGMGIAVEYGSENVTISNVTISDCWGDGVFLGDGSEPVSNVILENVTCDNNRRQGLSITHAEHVTVSDCTFKNTNGTAPQAGIDIEPDAGYTTTDITITNTQCTGNAGSGIDLMGISEYVYEVDISGCVLSENSGMGLRVYKAGNVSVADTATTNNFGGIEIPGDASELEFTGVTVTDNHWRGVSFVTAGQLVGCSDVVFESSVFSNNSKSYTNSEDGIRIDCWDQSGYIQNVTFSNCQFYDDQTSKTQRYGLTVGFTSGCMSGIVVEDSCTFYGNIADGYLGGSALQVNQ